MSETLQQHLDAMKATTELKKQQDAILGKSQEKGNKDSVFTTEVEREKYLFNLQETSLVGHAELIEKLASAKDAIRTEVRTALQDLKDTAAGGTAANYKKREAALKTIDDLGRAERMKQQAEMLKVLSGKEPIKAETTPIASKSPDQIKTEARIVELQKAAASAPIENNTPADLAKITALDAATKPQRLEAAAARTAKLQKELVGAKKIETPVVVPKSLAQQNMDTIVAGDKAFSTEISSLSLGDLTERNDNHYSEKTGNLFLEREAAESTTEKKRIQSILNRYSGALDMRKKNVPNPLESEKNFARTMRNIEEKK
ncbi:MAG: hypothetical protein WC774_00255 [Candidatus Gracilibacteria bacterium]|jgi:hypothetical protein